MGFEWFLKRFPVPRLRQIVVKLIPGLPGGLKRLRWTLREFQESFRGFK